jgi:hypothetical protein
VYITATSINKKDPSERDICSKFIGPAVKRAGWDVMMPSRIAARQFKPGQSGNPNSRSKNDAAPTAYALLIYDGQAWEVINPQTTKSALTGTTGSIGGSALSAGTCTSGTAAVTGAAVGHPVSVSSSDGSLPNGLIVLSAALTNSNVVTVQLCAVAAVTPTANTYNVATQ